MIGWELDQYCSDSQRRQQQRVAAGDDRAAIFVLESASSLWSLTQSGRTEEPPPDWLSVFGWRQSGEDSSPSPAAGDSERLEDEKVKTRGQRH